MKITNNFSLEEFCVSAKYPHLVNQPTQEEGLNIRALVRDVLQPLRDKLNKGITITSGFRGDDLNKAVGGVPTSQHRKGEASDFVVKGLSSKQVAEIILANEIPFDQLIVYPNFTHISYRRNGGNRRQVIYK